MNLPLMPCPNDATQRERQRNKLAVFSVVEVAFLLKMIVDRGMDREEFLQVSHAAEAQHRPLFFVGLAYVNSRLDC